MSRRPDSAQRIHGVSCEQGRGLAEMRLSPPGWPRRADATRRNGAGRRLAAMPLVRATFPCMAELTRTRGEGLR